MSTKIDLIKTQQAERLEQIREHTGMNQQVFAEYVDLQPGSYSDIKRGKSGISRNLLVKLEKKLNVNIDWLLTGTGDMLNAGEQAHIPKAVIPPYKKQLTEGVNAYIENLFRIIERKDEQIDRLLEAIRQRDSHTAEA